MLTGDDILDREIARLQHLIENRKISFLGRLSNSKPALFVIAIMVLLFQMRNLPETLANSSLDAVSYTHLMPMNSCSNACRISFNRGCRTSCAGRLWLRM